MPPKPASTPAPKPAGDKKPAASGSAPKPAAGDKKPAAGDKKPAAGDKKPAAGDKKPAAGDKKQAAPAKAGDKKAAAPAKAGDKKAAAPAKGGDKKAAAPAKGDKKAAAPAKVAGGKVTKGKKVAPIPSALKGKAGVTDAAPKVSKKKNNNPLIEKNAKNFGIGGTVQPKRDLGRFVKWPKYIRIQRQRAILKKRLKVPPSVNQFTKTLEKNAALRLFKLLGKYRPETAAQKQARLKAAASEKVEGEKKAEPKQKDPAKRPYAVKYGLNHITALIENKKAQLVVIADDVDPIELVVWLPALCRKLDVPYCIVKGKSRLGTVVHKKNATALAITSVRNEDKNELNHLVNVCRGNYNEKADDIRRSWGGGIMGSKSRARTAKLEKSKLREASAKRS